MLVNWSEGRTDCYVSERVGLIAAEYNYALEITGVDYCSSGIISHHYLIVSEITV